MARGTDWSGGCERSCLIAWRARAIVRAGLKRWSTTLGRGTAAAPRHRSRSGVQRGLLTRLPPGATTKTPERVRHGFAVRVSSTNRVALQRQTISGRRARLSPSVEREPSVSTLISLTGHTSQRSEWRPRGCTVAGGRRGRYWEWRCSTAQAGVHPAHRHSLGRRLACRLLVHLQARPSRSYSVAARDQSGPGTASIAGVALIVFLGS